MIAEVGIVVRPITLLQLLKLTQEAVVAGVLDGMKADGASGLDVLDAIVDEERRFRWAGRYPSIA